MCPAALNMAVFLLIGKTSALTMNIAGVIKDWLLIGLSVLLFKSPVTSINLGGCKSLLASADSQCLMSSKHRHDLPLTTVYSCCRWHCFWRSVLVQLQVRNSAALRYLGTQGTGLQL